jgi:hypothetical protein
MDQILSLENKQREAGKQRLGNQQALRARQEKAIEDIPTGNDAGTRRSGWKQRDLEGV